MEVEFELTGPAGTAAAVRIGSARTPVLAVDGALAPLGLTPVAGTVRATAPLALPAAETSGAAAFSLWPNPAHGTVRVAGAAPGAPLTLLDGTGRAVRTLRADGAGAATLSLAGLPVGVYAVRVGGAVRRLVVE